MADTVKLLNIGLSGSGKTGALVSLILAGYNLYILDFDNNSRIIRRILDDMGEGARWEAQVKIKSLRDKIAFVGGTPKIKPPLTAYKGAGQALAEWDAEAFGENDILVIDTLTKMSEAAFNEALLLGGRLNQRPQLGDYGWMADSVKLFIDMITAEEFACHVIVNTHIKFIEGNEELQTQARGLPNAKGQEISNTVAIDFNTIILTRTKGSGPGTRRIISTQPQGIIEVKNENPKGVKAEYTIETGLAEMFRDILGHAPPSPPAKEA